MSCIALRHKVLLQSVDEGAGPWIALDTRYIKYAERAIQVAVTNGDEITIQGITKESKGLDKSFLDNLSAADISDIKTYDTNTADVLTGSWTYIRAVKVGDSGFAKVQGFI